MTEVIHEIGDAELHAAQAVPATVEADGCLDAKAVFRDICHARHLPSEGTLFQLVHSHRCLEANHPAVDMVGKQTHINADDGFEVTHRKSQGQSCHAVASARVMSERETDGQDAFAPSLGNAQGQGCKEEADEEKAFHGT